MGLDSVELVIKVEKAFGINIPDEEAETLYTVGLLQDCVWKHLQAKQSSYCNSQFVFYKLRGELIERFQYSKQDLHPATSMNHIFPEQNRRRAFKDFGNALNLKLPELTLTT